MTAKPNLFIIGAMKSGTTSLHSYLDQHPQIAMSDNKEPGYFVEEIAWSKGEDWYLDLFDDAPGYLYRGESSTHYTKLPRYQGVAARMFRFNPDARLIYIMRDPFDRLVSHYWHAVRDVESGGEVRSIVKAIMKSPDYLAFSHYALQLRPYLDLFGKDSIHTLTFESMVRRPQAELDRIFDWLQIDRHPLGAAAAISHNQKPDRMVRVAGTGLLNRVQFSSTWDRISPYVPAFLKDVARQFAYRPVDEDQAANEISELRRMIRIAQRREVDALARLLDRDFPEWDEDNALARPLGTSLPEPA